MFLNKQKLIMLQNLLLIHGVIPGLQYAANKRVQSKINLFFILYFESYWKRENG